MAKRVAYTRISYAEKIGREMIAIVMGRRHAIIILLLQPTTHVNILFSIYYFQLHIVALSAAVVMIIIVTIWFDKKRDRPSLGEHHSRNSCH